MAATRLSMLLKHLHIKAKDLAREIHVDPSLVSRWQTGDRILDIHSDHLENIVSYIIKFDESTGYKNIETFFRYYSPDGEWLHSGDIHAALKKWLSMHPLLPQKHCLEKLDRPSSFSEVGIIKGEKEKKDALLNFLDIALASTEKKNVYIMIGLDTNNFLEKNPFYDQWVSRLHRILACGHNIYFIYNYSFSSFANNLKGFFSLCSSGSYHAYYLPKRGSLTYPFNLCVIEDIFALTDLTSSEEIKKPICFSFTDKDIVNQLKIEYMNYLSSCQLLKNDALINHEQIYKFLANRISEDQDVYIYDELPFLFPVSKELIRNILLYNNLNDAEIQYALQRYENLIIKQMLDDSDNDSVCHMILNIDTLLSHATDNYYIYPPLLISPHNIIIPRKFYRNYICELLEYVSMSNQNKKLQLKFVNNSHMMRNTGISFITKGHLFSLAFPYTTNQKNPMLFTNPTVISDTFNYLEEYWANIPDENNNIIDINAQLGKLVTP